MKISQVTICLNESEIIDCCIRNALPTVDEMIVVDGGSSDGTWERVKYWEKYNNKVRPFQRLQDIPPSLSTQINYGMDHATGEWIVCLDADVLYAKGTTKNTLLGALNQPSQIDLVEVLYYWVFNRAFTMGSQPKKAVLAMRNRPGARWIREIHQLPTVPPERRAFSPMISLLDYGRAKSVEGRKKKWKSFSMLKSASWKYGVPITEEFYMKDVSGDPLPQHLVPDLEILGWKVT